MMFSKNEQNELGLRFSFIIPCLTQPSVLRRCLDAIASQNYPLEKIEVIVVDDASPQPLELVCQDLRSVHPNLGKVECFRNASNLGRAATRNIGLSLASGDVFVFLDVDHILTPDFLACMTRRFDGRSCLTVRGNGEVPAEITRKSAYARYFASRYLGARPVSEMRNLDLDCLPPKFFATGCMAVSRDALDKVGGFDETFTQYGCEDEELGCRFAALGVPLQFAREARVFDDDADLSLERACRRMTVYAAQSLPLLLAKHPDYAAITTFALFEMPLSRLSMRQRFLRRALLFLLRPSLGIVVQFFLRQMDRVPPRLQPPSALYRIALTCAYLDGYRQRAAKRS